MALRFVMYVVLCIVHGISNDIYYTLVEKHCFACHFLFHPFVSSFFIIICPFSTGKMLCCTFVAVMRYIGYPKWKRLENKMNCMDMSNWCQVCTLCIHDVQWLWFQWNRDTSITIHQPSFHYGISVNMCVNSKLYSYVRTWKSFVIMSQIHIKCWIAI